MRAVTASILLLCLSTTALAQSNYKESSNSFAKYTNKGEFKELENAKKFIDAAYKTKRDSLSSKNNLLRAMVYSSLAYADSTRKIKSDKDHIDVALESLKKVRARDKFISENEINYINQNLIAAYIYKANKHVQKNEYEDAYKSFLEVERFGSQSEDLLRNLAYLSSKAGKVDDAINYYKKLSAISKLDVKSYISFAELYKKKGDVQEYLSILKNARELYPSDNTLLQLLLDGYAENKYYGAITPIVDQAIQSDPSNIDLYYLAGFANENTGNIEQSKKYYEKILDLDEEHYDANLALGLIYLNEFLKNNNSLEAQYSAQEFLIKANAKKPYAVNALKGLALFYETLKDQDQLDRVNMLLNQLSNN